MEDLMRLKDVCLKFPGGFFMDHLSFHVEKGEIFGFLGPSGAGKTTTIKLLTKQLVKEEGEIELFGKDILKITREDYERIGILSDMSSAYERMSIEENIKFFAEIRGVKKERAIDLLKEMHLFEARKTLVKKCSKGMRQRLILASAIMHEPELLFLDEPTSGLDPATIQAVHKILLELNRKGTTIFLTTHNMEEADKLCSRVGILNQGKLIACGSPEELKLSYAKNEIEVMRADRTKITVGKDEQGIEQILELMRNKDCLTIHSKEPNLEEIFIQLTGREF